MKTTKLILAIFTTILLLTTSSFAQTSNTTIGAENFSVQYAGSQTDYLYFKVTLKDFTNDSKVLKINDRTEGELYRQTLDAKTNTLTFKIEKNEGQVISFNLSVGEKQYNKTFSFATKITTNLIVEEDQVVAAK
jgi:Skp family chaperone for outer membrane proteins